MQCPSCDSQNLTKKGTNALSSGAIKQRYKCKDCGEHFMISLGNETIEDLFAEEDPPMYDDDIVDDVVQTYIRSDAWLKDNVYSKKRLVITSAQNNTNINSNFLNALKSYCNLFDAKLIAIPIKHRTITSQDDYTSNVYDPDIVDYLCENTLTFDDYNVKVYAGLKIQATAENPLSGLDPLSKGWTIIVGHAQVQLKTLPNLEKRVSDIITTTGAITEKNYSKTKIGEKALFNHSMSALVLEFDADGVYHIRHLNFDTNTNTFWDIDREFHSDGRIEYGEAEALVTGDEHAIFRDAMVEHWTYTSDKSIVNTIRPKYIVRHDTLDAYSVSHHHRKNIFTQFAKWNSNMNDIHSELLKTIDYVNDTTPEYSTSLIVQSNHNEHLLRWLNEVDIRTEPWNAIIYHYLMYKMLSQTKTNDSGTEHPDPFELIAREHLNENVQFVNRSGYKIMGIEVGSHGDIGINGARGSAKSFARIPDKMIVGHSHSPSIEKGCYTVGTSSRLKLEYNTGASTWHHAHVIIHRNGKRQMVFINSNGWRLCQ